MSAALPPISESTTYHPTACVPGVVTNIKCVGPMKDHPKLTLFTAMVQPLRTRRAVAVSLTRMTGDPCPEPDEFLSALLADLLHEHIPAA